MHMCQEDRIHIEKKILPEILLDQVAFGKRTGIDHDGLGLTRDRVAGVYFGSDIEDLVISVMANQHSFFLYLIVITNGVYSL